MSERLRQIIVGLIGLTLFFSVTIIGVQFAFGYFADEYRVHGSFAAAGQGLISESDVKIRGVNVGKVAGVELRGGRAWVKMDIEQGERIPVTARAVVRPKTLFGEKFVDIEPGDDEVTGPFLADGDTIEQTLGGFELEQVLTDAYPILAAIDPAELVVVLGNLADGGRGLGEEINRSIVNFGKIAEVYRRHDADTRQFLDDFAELADELALRADDLVAGAVDLNEALPSLNRRRAQLSTVLDDAARLSGDLADVFDANRDFFRVAITEGGRPLQVLYDERAQVGPVLTSLRQYVQLVAESLTIEVGDGTLMGKVKGILGGDPCGKGGGVTCLVPVPTAGGNAGPAPASAPPTTLVPGVTVPELPLPSLPLPVAEPSRNGSAVTDLIGGLL